MRRSRSAFAGSSALLLDTHVLVWLATGDPRLSARFVDALGSEDNKPLVSTITAWEYADLHARGRFPGAVGFSQILQSFVLEVVPLPVDVWRTAEHLPDIHRDPVDRMLVAHALLSDLPIATADRHIARYPVETIW